MLTQAQLFIVNGLGLEGWLTRLIQSARYGGPVVVATAGIAPVTTTEAGQTKPSPDPHAWQDPRNGVVYAENIARALTGVDPGHAEAYRQRLVVFAQRKRRRTEINAHLSNFSAAPP